MNAPDGPAGGKEKRFTVSVTEKGERSLRNVQKLREEHQNAAVNTAVILYNDIAQVIADGGDVFIRRPGEEEPQRLHIL